MPTNYSDGSLIRAAITCNIGGANYLFKTLKLDIATRSAYEYDASGLPKASSHVDDFEKFSGEIMGYTGTNVPPKFTLFLGSLGSTANTNYILTEVSQNKSTEGLVSYTVAGVKLYN